MVEEAYLANKWVKNNGKLEHKPTPPMQPPKCPECGSTKAWRDGLRNGSTQRWLCRDCGYRYSEPSLRNKKVPQHNTNRQVCDMLAEASKNLAEVSQTEAGQREASETSAGVKGKLVGFLWELKKRGLKDSSIVIYQHYLQQLIKHGANILDPESIKEVLVKQAWSENTKALAIASYSRFLEFQGGTWTPPKCKGVRKIPFIPLESELDQLISGAYTKMATFLQLLKETGMRAGEALSLKWTEVDFKNGAITLNQPEKYGKPRMFKISSTLLAMLSTLPKQNDFVFGRQNPRNFARIYRKYRKRMAFKLQNPRLKQISFHTFRHWKATTEYYKTKDILHVMDMLGHRDIKTTLIYTQLIHFESDEYHSAVAKTVDEARALIETGFEHVCNYEGVMLFRKRK
ncbi:MAG: tyrosine-type recombinase/integrase [Candidatus Bathyarchaeia archaeon]